MLCFSLDFSPEMVPPQKTVLALILAILVTNDDTLIQESLLSFIVGSGFISNIVMIVFCVLTSCSARSSETLHIRPSRQIDGRVGHFAKQRATDDKQSSDTQLVLVKIQLMDIKTKK